MQPTRAVAFDLDGTLVDTFAITLQTTQYVLRQFLSRPVPDSEVIPLYGTPLPQVMARFLPEQAEAMVLAFEDYYLARQAELVHPFSGVVETLQALEHRGYLLAILSNKRKGPGLRELEVCGLEGFFHSVLFLEDLLAPKPAPEALGQSARILGVALSEVLYVGDSILDVQCARQAGVRSAAALWSGLNREELVAQRPDHLLAAVGDLLALCPSQDGR